MPLNIFDYTPYDKKGNLSVVERVRGRFSYGTSWFADNQAQEKVISPLKRLLNDRYNLFRNFIVPREDIPIPLVLIGPQGLRVLNVSDTSGIFQVQGEEWLGLDSRTEEYQPAAPNYIKRTQDYSRAIQTLLGEEGIDVDPLEPVLFLTNPGVTIDSQSPAIRVVRIDALKRFIPTLGMGPITMDGNTVSQIAETLIEIGERDPSEFNEEVEEDPEPDFPEVRFTLRQWLIIGGLIAVNLVVVFIIIALLLTDFL